MATQFHWVDAPSLDQASTQSTGSTLGRRFFMGGETQNHWVDGRRLATCLACAWGKGGRGVNKADSRLPTRAGFFGVGRVALLPLGNVRY